MASRPKARTTSGKKIQACGFGQPAACGDGEDADAQDHRADVLGGGGLEEVRAAAGAVADVVADEVRDDARVARVVLGDALLDLADEVGADVGGLGVDAAAELGEERHERGAEAEADDEERRVVRRLAAVEAAERGEDAETPSSDRATTRKPETAPPRIATWTASTRLRRAAAAVRTFGLDADVHADDPRGHRADGADEEREAGPHAEVEAEDARCRRPLRSRTMVMTAPMTNAPTTARMPMVVYWRRMKATAPSKIVPATSCIAWGPVSRDRTSRAR